jgi:hypothetical protein
MGSEIINESQTTHVGSEKSSMKTVSPTLEIINKIGSTVDA